MVKFQCDGKRKKNESFLVFVRKCLIFSQKSRRALPNWEQLIVNYVLIVE